MAVNQPNGPAVFPDVETFIRDWGSEAIVAKTGFYTLKCIDMLPNAKGGLQYHHEKDESGYVVYGSGTVEYDAGDGALRRRRISIGDTVRFPQGAVHRITAGDRGLTYYEASTPHLNDRCHVEHEYGEKAETGGLPTTRKEDVVTIPLDAGIAKPTWSTTARIRAEVRTEDAMKETPHESIPRCDSCSCGKQESPEQELKELVLSAHARLYDTCRSIKQDVDRLVRKYRG